MQLPRAVRSNFQQPMVQVSMAAVAAHLIASALFHMEASLDERLSWAVLVAGFFSLAAFTYERMQPLVRGVVCVAIAVPALAWGIGLHAVHVVQLGVEAGDLTGLPMLVAGAVLFLTGSTFLIRIVRAWWHRALLAAIVPVFGFFVVFPITLGVGASNVARVPCCDETPADHGFAYEDVTFETLEGVAISAWFVPSTNGATIITVHGAGNNRETTLPEAMVLARHGYGLLLLDAEGYGNSEGRGNAFGWVGARDVHAAIEYLESRSDVDPARIGGLGLSMGGEVLLQAAGESNALQAVVAEGVTGRTARDFREMDELTYDIVISAIHNVAGFTMSAISGEDSPPPLKQMVAQIAPRRVLLIAASLPEEEHLMGMYQDIGGYAFELWTIPEAKHVGSFDLHPAEFEQRVVAFFDGALLPDRPLADGR